MHPGWANDVRSASPESWPQLSPPPPFHQDIALASSSSADSGGTATGSAATTTTAAEMRELCLAALTRYVNQWMEWRGDQASVHAVPEALKAGERGGREEEEAAEGGNRPCEEMRPASSVAALNAMLVRVPKTEKTDGAGGLASDAAAVGSLSHASLTSCPPSEKGAVVPLHHPPTSLLEVATQLLQHSKWLAAGVSHAAGPAVRLPSATLITHAYEHALLVTCASDWVVAMHQGDRSASLATESPGLGGHGLPSPPLHNVTGAVGGAPVDAYRGALVLLILHPLHVIRIWARDSLLRLMGAVASSASATSPQDCAMGVAEATENLVHLLRFALLLLCTLKHLSTLPRQLSFCGTSQSAINTRACPSSVCAASDAGDLHVTQDRVDTVAEGLTHLLTLLTAWDEQFGAALATHTPASSSATSLLLGQCRATVLLLGGSLVLDALCGTHQRLHRAVMDVWRERHRHHPLSFSVKADTGRAGQVAMAHLLRPLNTLLSVNPRMPRGCAVTAIAIRKVMVKVLVHGALDAANGVPHSEGEEASRRERLEWLWAFAAALEPPTPRVGVSSLLPGQGDTGGAALVRVPCNTAGWMLRPLLRNASQQLQWEKAMVTAKTKPSSWGSAAAAPNGEDVDGVAVLDKAVYGVHLLLSTAASALPRLLNTWYFHDALATHEAALLTLTIGGIVHTRSLHAIQLHRLLLLIDVRAFAGGAAAAQGMDKMLGTAAVPLTNENASDELLVIPNVCFQRFWLTLPSLITQVCKCYTGVPLPPRMAPHVSASHRHRTLPLPQVLGRLCGSLAVLIDEASMPCPHWLLTSSPAEAMAGAPPPFQWVVQRSLRILTDTLRDQHELLVRVWLGLPSMPADVAVRDATSAAASSCALTSERDLLHFVNVLQHGAPEDAGLRKLSEQLSAIFCIGITSSVSRVLLTEAAVWVWRCVVLTQPVLRVSTTAATAALSTSIAAESRGTPTAWDLTGAATTSAARTQGHHWLSLLCEIQWAQMQEWEVQCGWWMAALLADVVPLDVEQRRSLSDAVILALPTAPMQVDHKKMETLQVAHQERAIMSDDTVTGNDKPDGSSVADACRCRRHAVVQHLFLCLLRKAERYPRENFAEVLLHVSDALPVAMAMRDVQFQQCVQPLLVHLCARRPDVQERLVQEGAPWLRQGAEAAGATMQACLAEQERRFRQFELEESNLRQEEEAAMKVASAAECLRHGNETKRKRELAVQRTAAFRPQQGTEVGPPSSSRLAVVKGSADGPAAAPPPHLSRQQLLFPQHPPGTSSMRDGHSPLPSTAPELPAEVTVVEETEDVVYLSEDSDVEVVTMHGASPTAAQDRSANAPLSALTVSSSLTCAPPVKSLKLTASETASAVRLPTPTRLQQKLQVIHSRNTHRVHHAQQLLQLRARVSRVAVCTNLLHLRPSLIHDIVGTGSQCMASEVPVLPEVFVSAANVCSVPVDTCTAAGAPPPLRASMTMPFGDAANVYAMRFAPHIALELRYDIIRGYEDFYEDLRRGDRGGRHGYGTATGQLAAPTYADLQRLIDVESEAGAPPSVRIAWSQLLPLHPGVVETCLAVRSVIVKRPGDGVASAHEEGSSICFDVRAAAQDGISAAISQGDVVAILLPLHSLMPMWVEREFGCPLNSMALDELRGRLLAILRTLPRRWRDLGCAVQVCHVQSLNPGERTARLRADYSIVEDATVGQGTPPLRVLHVFRLCFSATRPSTFYVRKLSSLNAAFMELEALHTVDHTRFATTLYDPRYTAPVSTAFHLWIDAILTAQTSAGGALLLPELRRRLLLENDLNNWQIRAIMAVLYAVCQMWDENAARKAVAQPAPRAPEVLMIEGPPGTGKTQTIGSLTLNLLHHLDCSAGTTPRILVCAPSNCAVDEALLRVVRLRQQLLSSRDELRHGGGGASITPSHAVLGGHVLRLGVREKVDEAVLRLHDPVFFDDVVTQKLSCTTTGAAGGRVGVRTGGKERPHPARGGLPHRYSFRDRDVVRAQTLESASLFFSTLGSLHNISRYADGLRFDVVIVDEASQGTEPAVLQAITLASKKCVLVGDSRQLQPTVLSPEAGRCGLRRSLLMRLLACGHRSFMLRTQYRMHPDIVAFPNAYFYSSQLLTADSVLQRSCPSDDRVPTMIAQRLGRCPRFAFVDVRSSCMERLNASLRNRDEAAAVVQSVRQLRTFLGLSVRAAAEQIGIITFYTAQREAIRERFTPEERRSGLQVATVDSFQGKEKRIILLSCVRTVTESQLRRLRRSDTQHDAEGGDDAVAVEERCVNKFVGRYGLGFLADGRRLNVALTRAQELCICFGSRSTLCAVGMAVMDEHVRTHTITTADSSAEVVEAQLDADEEDPLALFRMLEHAEKYDSVAHPLRCDGVVANGADATADSSRPASACLTHDINTHLMHQLAARAPATMPHSAPPPPPFPLVTQHTP